MKNLWLFFRMPFLACLGIVVITAIVFPTAGLTTREVCRPIEMILPFIGVTAMVPIFLPEQDAAIYDSVACRKLDMVSIYALRLVISLVLTVIVIISYCCLLKINECDVTPYVMWGGVASAFFSGSIGFAVAGLTGNVINGLLASMIYYLCNYGLRKELGVFYLFRMSTEVYEGKGVLFLVGAILVMITFVYLKRKTLILYLRKLAKKFLFL